MRAPTTATLIKQLISRMVLIAAARAFVRIGGQPARIDGRARYLRVMLVLDSSGNARENMETIQSTHPIITYHCGNWSNQFSFGLPPPAPAMFPISGADITDASSRALFSARAKSSPVVEL
jgi:hypothetical protein